ncbi:peptide/nickel transport system permease protein [Ruminiclostridium sufflavum DSM 19573]|uniref:Peptide/nickel transport system permease protein n=1 Tax=Ruminiclostridium sufflavum DSM 19573 TaxID=1121337 RepID=A0A318XQB2_9FIRM|nr:ABC transporter permease [Ruminiclostridium sufflavum]PYG90265.1 peptide/nickel transport system permease protein [Ruminiclostridium sufflavum DSM 19573]
MREKKNKAGVEEIRRRSMFSEAMARLVRNKTAMFGFFILVTVVLLCLAADIISPGGYDQQDMKSRFVAPGLEHIFGTDHLGRSMLARVLYGGRNSLLIGFAATVLGAAAGIILGTISAYYGNMVDNIIMRILDVFNSIPNLLLAIVISSALGSGKVNTIIAVGISTIPGFARTVRGPILAIMGMDYIEAARTIDAKDSRIMFRHLLPNVLSPIIVQFTLGTAISILCVSSLSFLGMGIQPPEPEWGALLSYGRQYLNYYPYLCTVPGVAIALIVFSMNLFGDGLRDALDPRLKN